MRISFLTDHTAPRPHAFCERIVGLWNQSHPDELVEFSTLDHEILKRDLETHLRSEPPPDVLTMVHNGWYAGNRSGSHAGDGLMMNVADLWEVEGFSRSYADAFQRIAATGADVYFLPTSFYWWAVYYRPSVFRAVGVAAPIETWEDLLAACQVFRSAGLHPFALGARHGCPAAAWFDYLDSRLNGPEFHDRLLLLRESYTDRRVRTVFDHWGRLLDSGCFAGEPAVYDEAEAVDLVRRGEAAMVLIGAYVADEYAPDLEPDLDCFRFPIVHRHLPVGEDAPVDGYFAAGKSANPGGARRFLAFLGSREVQQLAIDELSALPTRTDVNCRRASRLARRGLDLIGRADHVSQFYNLDTPEEMGEAGMRAFVSYLREPGQIDDLLDGLESLRLELVEKRR